MLETTNQQSTAAMFHGQTSEGRILIVDDEPDVRNVVRRTLQKAGYEVLEAEDGTQAVQEIQQGENPLLLDVIITDIRMPNLNGLEAISFFQEQFPHVSLIVLTGYPDVNMGTTLINGGVVDYLVKPVDKDNILTAVSKAMEQREICRL